MPHGKEYLMMQYSIPFFSTEEEKRDFVRNADLRMEARLEQAAEQLLQTPDIRIFGLTGPSCSGKTTAAAKLNDVFSRNGHRVHIISLDDFYYDKASLNELAQNDPLVEIDYDSEKTIDTQRLARETERLLLCREAEIPRFNFRTGQREGVTRIEPREGDLFLFEGIQVLYPKVRACLEKGGFRSIYIAPQTALTCGEQRFEPNELRLMRRIVRDSLFRAAAPEFTVYLWESVRENEEKNIFPYVKECSVSIDSTLPYEVGMLRPYLERILCTEPKDASAQQIFQTILQKIQDVQPLSKHDLTEKSLYKEFIE